MSQALRLGPGLSDLSLRTTGATFNAVAIGLFAATVTGAALTWRRKYGAPGARKVS